MELILTCLFWSSLACILYTYLGYPCALWVLARFTRCPVEKGDFAPEISIVIAVWNEAPEIARRLDNLLAQDYPAGRTEILVVSDGCDDGTEEVVARYRDRNVRHLRLPGRNGKSFTLNQGVAAATGEIVVFADARQQFAPGAVAALVANFHDPRVGCVSGELILVKDEVSRIQAEMGAYWSYEKWIRKAESRTGSMVGATGAIYAIRRKLHIPLPPGTILDDVLTPLRVAEQGYRCVFDSSSLAYDLFSKDTGVEWSRKVRTLTGNWQLLSLQPGLLLPWRNPCWWRFISHKIMRLLVPLALVVLFVSGALLPGTIYRWATSLQCLPYGAAAVTGLVPVARSIRITRLCRFFLILNAAAACGFWQWITGGSSLVWGKNPVGPAAGLPQAKW